MPKAAAAPREEIASSCLSLKKEIEKFHFEEDETQRAQVVHISDTEDEPDRHSGVHALILVIARPDNTSDEEDDEMTLNWGNSLRDLMATRNKGQLQKESLSPKFLPLFPLLPFYPLLTSDCTLFQI